MHHQCHFFLTPTTPIRSQRNQRPRLTTTQPFCILVIFLCSGNLVFGEWMQRVCCWAVAWRRLRHIRRALLPLSLHPARLAACRRRRRFIGECPRLLLEGTCRRRRRHHHPCHRHPRTMTKRILPRQRRPIKMTNRTFFKRQKRIASWQIVGAFGDPSPRALDAGAKN